jgi:hypothetical protein
MPKEQAQQDAIERARAELTEVNIAARCAALSLPEPAGGRLLLRMFGRECALILNTLELIDPRTGEPAKAGDLILLLHFLQCDMPVVRTGELVSFREFSGGQFYYEPFRSRTVKPLLGRFGGDLDGLRRNLARFDWTPYPRGDVGVRIRALGPLEIVLIYNAPDEEFGASAEVLFDAAAKRALCAEDAAVLASRICIGLL